MRAVRRSFATHAKRPSKRCPGRSSATSRADLCERRPPSADLAVRGGRRDARPARPAAAQALGSTGGPLKWDGDPPELRSPVLVAAFAGWNDAASAATTALEAIAVSLDAELVAEIDPEEFYDFQVTRPTIRMTEGQTREVDWPENTIIAAVAPAAERDLVLVSGIEPNLRWRTFAEAVIEAAERLGVEMVVTLGALLADVPHTRPVPITGLASDPELVERLALSRSNYEGPTGIVGILHDACRRRGLTSASLWAAVPHYVAAVPNPKAALALLRRLEGFTGIAIEASELEEAMERFETQVDRAVAANPEIEELVRRLESEQADEPEIDTRDMPSGDAIAQDFQRFLRQRADEPRPELAARPRRPGRSAGSRTRSRSRATAAARSPGRDPGRDLEHGALDPLGVVGLGPERDPLVGEHVPVAAAVGVDLATPRGRRAGRARAARRR